MPRLRETLPTCKGKAALRQKVWEISPLPKLPDPAWNQAIQAVLHPLLSVDSSDETAFMYFMGNWRAIVWYMVLNRDPGLLPRGFKVPKDVQRCAESQANIAKLLLLTERLCIESHPASTYGAGVSDYPNHLYWFTEILLECQRHGWNAVLRGEGKREGTNNSRLIYKSLRGDTASEEIENPFQQNESPHLYNLIEVCRYKNRYQSGFRKLWDKYLKALRTSNNIAAPWQLLLSVNGKACLSTGSGKGMIVLKTDDF